MNNNPNELTTRYETTIDATFYKYIDILESRSLFTYYNYHKSIVSFFEDSEVNPKINNEWTNLFITKNLLFHCKINKLNE